MVDNRDTDSEDLPLISDESNDRSNESSDQIKDRFAFVRITFGLIGLSQLISWNFFITATDYWNYKFRDINETNYESIRSTNSSLNSLQKYFESYLSIATNLPFLVVLVFNAFLGQKIKESIKTFWSFITILLIFITTTIFVEINTDNYQNTFFGLTILSVVLLSICSAFLQSSVSGIASVFPSECMHYMVTGQAVSGIFSSFAQLLALTANLSPTKTALTYFLMADITLIISLFMFHSLNKNEYYNYHKQKVNQSRRLNSLPVTSNEENNLSSLLKAIWTHLVSAMMIFWVTLSVFPSITVLVVPEQSLSSGKYFIPIACFLLFNLSDFLGRFGAQFIPIFVNNKYLLLLASIMRITLIPLIMFCNVIPRSYLPVLFSSELYFILFIFILGFTNGFVLINVMISGPTFVSDQYKERVGFFIVSFVGLGLALGSFSSNILLRLL